MNSDNGENQTNTELSEERVDYKLIAETLMALGLQVKNSYPEEVGPMIIGDMIIDLGISVRNGTFFEAYAAVMRSVLESKEQSEDQLKSFFDGVKDVH